MAEFQNPSGDFIRIRIQDLHERLLVGPETDIEGLIKDFPLFGLRRMKIPRKTFSFFPVRVTREKREISVDLLYLPNINFDFKRIFKLKNSCQYLLCFEECYWGRIAFDGQKRSKGAKMYQISRNEINTCYILWHFCRQINYMMASKAIKINERIYENRNQSSGVQLYLDCQIAKIHFRDN